MGYGNYISLNVYTNNRRKKVCCLYDSEVQQPGAVYNIKRKIEMNGWKELSFTIPININGEKNWRIQFITNEYEVCVMDGDEKDWFRITEPTESDDGVRSDIDVVCPHSSFILKKRNIYLAFDDENGIGTLNELAERVLDGTGWTLGYTDKFYEPNDGETEKIRTYHCNEKTGAYAMIQDLCDKFGAYPVFNGDARTVDLLDRSKRRGMIEMSLSKNLVKMARKRDSTDVVTR